MLKKYANDRSKERVNGRFLIKIVANDLVSCVLTAAETIFYFFANRC